MNSYVISITDDGISASACSVLPVGSVLIAMYGGGGTIGKNAILEIPACINQALCALLPNRWFDEQFAFRFIQFYKPFWMIGAVSSRIDPNISQDLIRNSPLVRPPLAEQKEIVRYLDLTLEQFDQLEQRSATAVLLLQERRAALISAAVTGKIDVRSYSKQNTEEAA